MRGTIPTKEELYRTNREWLIQDAKNMILQGKDFDAVIDDYQRRRKELENDYATTSQAEIDLLREMVVAFCGSTVTDYPQDSADGQAAVKELNDEMIDICAADPSAILGVAATGILKWEDVR